MFNQFCQSCKSMSFYVIQFPLLLIKDTQGSHRFTLQISYCQACIKTQVIMTEHLRHLLEERSIALFAHLMEAILQRQLTEPGLVGELAAKLNADGGLDPDSLVI